MGGKSKKLTSTPNFPGLVRIQSSTKPRSDFNFAGGSTSVLRLALLLCIYQRGLSLIMQLVVRRMNYLEKMCRKTTVFLQGCANAR